MKKKIKLRTQSRTKLAKHAIFAIEIKQNARAKKVEESRKCVLIPDQWMQYYLLLSNGCKDFSTLFTNKAKSVRAPAHW